MEAFLLTPDTPACPLNYPAFVFRQLVAKGYGAEPLLRGVDLTEEQFQDPASRVEFTKLRRFILNAMDATGDAHLGPRLARDFQANFIGPPAYAAINAPSLAAGLDVFGRFMHLTFPAIEFAFPPRAEDLQASEAEVWIRPKLQLLDIEYFVMSSALLVLHGLLKEMLRKDLVASRCEVTIAEPEGWAAISGEISRVPVRFQALKNRIIFPAELLDQPLPGADPINHRRLTSLCQSFSADMQPLTTPICQVRSYLEADSNQGASLAEAAAALGYSERGLRRHLERSGASFRKLQEEVLQRRAQDMLAETAKPIHTIAYDLGYETPSNFARSFKRWTGTTPKAFRDERKGGRRSGRK